MEEILKELNEEFDIDSDDFNDLKSFSQTLNPQMDRDELRNIIERAVLIADDDKMILPDQLSLTGRDYFAAGGSDRRSSSCED